MIAGLTFRRGGLFYRGPKSQYPSVLSSIVVCVSHDSGSFSVALIMLPLSIDMLPSGGL